MTDRYASLKQGLVGCWIPSISGSGLLLPDLSGRNYHGALSNSADILWTGVLGKKATSFSGADTGVLCANSPSHLQFSNSTVMSATAWIYTRSTDTLNAIASAVHQNANTNNFFWSIDCNAGGVGLTLGRANVNANFVSMSRLDDQWQHLAMTFDTTKVSGWRNGVFQGSSNYTQGTVGLNDRQLWIGRDSNGSNRGFKGFVDDVRVYNRILTESEIRLLASRPGIGLRQESHRQTFYQFPSGARRKRILTGMP